MAKRFNDVPYHTFSSWTDMVVVCPKCGKAGTVHFDKEHNTAVFQCNSCYTKEETVQFRNYVFEDTRYAEDPYFHYPLYFQASFRGKTIWALNREHLQYLIDYLSADLRTVQSDFHKKYKTMRSQSDMLPTFMKTAKNRDGIIKMLTKLQAK